MSKLISAGLIRLFRLKSLYISLAVIAFEVIINICGETSTYHISINTNLLSGVVISLIASAVVVGNLIGAEYNFGTIRNQLIVGHNRTEIYFANYIVSFTGIIIMHVFGAGLVFAAGLPFGSVIGEGLLTQLFVQLIFAFVITSLYVLIAMNIHSKSSTLTVTIIISFIMLFANITMAQLLSEPEFIDANSQLYDDSGTTLSSDAGGKLVPNPFYVGGTKRIVMEIADNLLPCSGIMEYNGDFNADKIITEVCETIIFTAAGVLIFRKRDLK